MLEIEPCTDEWWAARKEMFEIADVLGEEFGFTERMRKNALILIGGTYVGHNPAKLSRFTGVTRYFICKRTEKLFEAGIWSKDGKTNCGWLGEHGGIAFMLDVLVLEGKARRVPPEPELWGNGKVLLF